MPTAGNNYAELVRTMKRFANEDFASDLAHGLHRDPRGNREYDAEYERLAAETGLRFELYGNMALSSTELSWIAERRKYCDRAAKATGQ
jgi:hypothetical protein